MLLAVASVPAAFAQQLPTTGRVARLCGSGHQEIIALMLRPDNMIRALKCASGLDSPGVDRGEVIARLLDDIGQQPRWAHEEVLKAALVSWQSATGAASDGGGAVAALADALPQLSVLGLRDEALRALLAARTPSLAAMPSGEGERLGSQLRNGATADPALGRLVARVAEVAVAAARMTTTADNATPGLSSMEAPTPLLADVLARLIEVAPDTDSVSAAQMAATRLVAAFSPPIATATDGYR